MIGRRDRPPGRDDHAGARAAGGRPGGPDGRRGPQVGRPVVPLPALAVGDGEALRAGLERAGAGRALEIVATLPAEAALEPGRAPEAVALAVAPWPAGLGWLSAARPGSALGGALPVLLVGGDPPRARLVVEAPGESLPAALEPAAGGPLVGLASELARLRQENRDLREALEARKAIERAKGILMEQEGISEAEAFSRIQRLSMARRKPMKEVSEAIILSREASTRGA